ncbi:hypothetical protein FNF29_07580 [Cafeteria roenbergensis]|uniref:Uncharacterized protein n=1 Tax=Cafeteria roenbergensis TaxID=33653 RepID=A0A5A8C4S0_CAFRO|nr:hypothetical protein FNF29_07580 [Cafeteria roenbergensis]|eukprot:KAA0147090.1 hypothetical protein FNF29_07580 [Cafeteria roenbergensis]
MAAAKRRHVVTDSDDEDDEVPLAALAAQHKVVAPVGGVAGAARTAATPPKRAKKRAPSASSGNASKRVATERTATIASKKAASKGRSSSASRSSAASKSKKYAKDIRGKGGIRTLDTDWPLKHQVAEAILRRWTYSGLPYPPADLDESVDEGFMALRGFPGVTVGIVPEHMGVIVDRRPKEPRPSLAFLLTVSCDTLFKMLRAALEGQRHALLESEGADAMSTPAGKALKADEKPFLAVTQAGLPSSKIDKQAMKHEIAQGRPELAKRIEASTGDEALRRAGGLRPVPGTSLIGAPKPERSTSSSAAASAAASSEHADAAPITAQ